MGDSNSDFVVDSCRVSALAVKLFVISLLLVAFLLVCTTPPVMAANIRGVVYDHSYNPLQKIVVTINTTPQQVKISTTGAYYFTVPNGTYTIAVTLTKNNVTKTIASQEVTLAESDDIVKDLQLFDNFDIEKEFSENWITKTQDFIKDKIEIFVIITLTLVVILAVIYGLSWYRRKILSKATDVIAKEQVQQLPDGLIADITATTTDVSTVNIELVHSAEEKSTTDQTAVVIASQPVVENKTNDELMKERITKLIAESNGSLTQKDLRKEFSVSEAKISMILTAMESDGTIKKVKKGRVNYLQLVGVVKNS